MGDQDVSDYINYLQAKPVTVRSINLDGLVRVKDDVVLPHIKPLLESNTLGDLIQDTADIKYKLDSLNAFKTVQIDIEPYIEGSRDVQINISVEEKRWYTVGGTVASDLGVNGQSVQGNLTMGNLFGRLESLAATASTGTKISHGYNLEFNKPILSKPSTHLKADISKVAAINPTCGYNTSDYNSSILYQFLGLGGNNTVQVTSLWQQVFGATNTKLPIPIREHFGHHVKCAAKHSYSIDTRDNPAIPTKGCSLEVNSEVAGFLGDVNHVKCEGRYQYNFPFVLGFNASASVHAGYLHSMNNDRVTKITDRFFSGGPGSIRGFYTDGVGDNASGRPLGGIAHWGSGVSLIRKLPFHPYVGGLGQFMRVHLFANAGSLSSDGFNYKDTRVSVGAGLILTDGRFRMEINYAVPLLFKQTDVINNGLQFGVGVNFL